MEQHISPAEADEAARAINAYNARVHAAIDELLASVAWWVVTYIGAPLLGLWIIASTFGFL